MRTLKALLLTSALATPVYAVDADTSDAPVAFDVTFMSHVAAGMAEQDVYVASLKGESSKPSSVYRPGAEDADLDAPLFASATPQAHNPVDPNGAAPFPKGAALNFSLGDWLGASGEGHYRAQDGKGHLRIEFEGLVPNGVYTLWHFFMPNGETEPFIGTFDLPVGAFDGSQATFIADAEGSATFEQTFDPALQLTGAQLAAGLAVNFHSDGQTYGVLPGAFGKTAHIQLFAPLPSASGN